MRLVRLATCAALAGSLLVVGTSHAAAKPVCNLVTDPVGDANLVGPDPSTDALDITSVDVASDKTNVTAVLRVKALKATSSSAPIGIVWAVKFTADGAAITLQANADASGTVSFDGSYKSATNNSLYGAGVTGVFDTVKNEVRITAPLALISGQTALKAGTAVTAISGRTAPQVRISDVSGAKGGGTLFSYAPLSIDATDPGLDYKAGTASCVIPGK
jgi:hypothetical protein